MSFKNFYTSLMVGRSLYVISVVVVILVSILTDRSSADAVVAGALALVLFLLAKVVTSVTFGMWGRKIVGHMDRAMMNSGSISAYRCGHKPMMLVHVVGDGYDYTVRSKTNGKHSTLELVDWVSDKTTEIPVASDTFFEFHYLYDNL